MIRLGEGAAISSGSRSRVEVSNKLNVAIPVEWILLCWTLQYTALTDRLPHFLGGLSFDEWLEKFIDDLLNIVINTEIWLIWVSHSKWDC